MQIYNILYTAYIGYLVGLEQTFFKVLEDVGQVELCVNVTFPITKCPISIQFNVSLSTHNRTAGIHNTSPYYYTLLFTLYVMDSVSNK